MTDAEMVASHSVCPDCGNGWTFDFLQKRVYCRTCEAFALVRRLADVYTVDTDQAALIGLVAAAKQLVMPTPASPLPRPEARLQEQLADAHRQWADDVVKYKLQLTASEAEVRALEARLRAVVAEIRGELKAGAVVVPISTAVKWADELDAILRPSATLTQPENTR